MATDAAELDVGAPVEPPLAQPPPAQFRSRAFDEPSGWGRIGRYALLLIVTFLVLFPIYTTVIAALKPGGVFGVVDLDSCDPDVGNPPCTFPRQAPVEKGLDRRRHSRWERPPLRLAAQHVGDGV